METIKIKDNEVELIDIYIATYASDRLPKLGSMNHYTVYSRGYVYTNGYGDGHEMKKHMLNDYCTSLIWLRNAFYDE